MSKPKLLITGVSGFIGQALVTELHNEYKIYGLYESAKNLHKNPEIPRKRQWVADLRNAAFVEYVVKVIKPDFVVHLAARSEVANSFDNYQEVADINYKGTVILAEALRKYVPELVQFVFASTMETYGHQPEVPFTEETEQFPMAPYAVAKVASEKYLEYMKYAYDFPFTILRQTNTYGRHDNNFFVMERIISQFLTDFWSIDLGDPKPKRNFLHISDLVSLYSVVLGNFDAIGETYVTGPDNAISIEDLYYKIADRLGHEKEAAKQFVKWGTIPRRPGEIMYLNSNPEKVAVDLGWTPIVDLDEGIELTIELLYDQKHGKGATWRGVNPFSYGLPPIKGVEL